MYNKGSQVVCGVQRIRSPFPHAPCLPCLADMLMAVLLCTIRAAQVLCGARWAVVLLLSLLHVLHMS